MCLKSVEKRADAERPEKILTIGGHLPAVPDQLIVRVNDMLLKGNA
jgi:hypothetical protein